MERIFVDIEGECTHPSGGSRLQTLCQMQNLAQTLKGHAGIKVGDVTERFGAERVLPEFAGLGIEVFHDLKFCDTADRMLRRLRSYAELGRAAPTYLTVVAFAAPAEELAQLVEKAGSIKILLLTALSSWSDAYCIREFRAPLADIVRRNTAKATAIGAPGIVLPSTCLKAAAEVSGFDQLIRVVPGVRSSGAKTHDQKNTNTPAKAFRDGASIIVLGRQITHAPDPLAELLRVREECAGFIPAA